jgi:hypothetical protein
MAEVYAKDSANGKAPWQSDVRQYYDRKSTLRAASNPDLESEETDEQLREARTRGGGTLPEGSQGPGEKVVHQLARQWRVGQLKDFPNKDSKGKGRSN